MMHVPPPRGPLALDKATPDSAWRSRTLLACLFLALVVLTIGGWGLDWSEGAAMIAGELAGMISPLVLIALAVWAVYMGSRRANS